MLPLRDRAARRFRNALRISAASMAGSGGPLSAEGAGEAVRNTGPPHLSPPRWSPWSRRWRRDCDLRGDHRSPPPRTRFANPSPFAYALLEGTREGQVDQGRDERSRRSVSRLGTSPIRVIVIASVVLYVGLALFWLPSSFSKFTMGSKQSEAKGQLSWISVAQMEFKRSNGKYARTFSEMRYSPREGMRYSLLMGDELWRPAGIDAPTFDAKSVPDCVKRLDYRFAGSERYRAFAVAKLHGDDWLDVWMVDDNGKIENVFSGASPDRFDVQFLTWLRLNATTDHARCQLK